MATVLKRTESEAELRQRVDRYARSWAERGTLHVFAVAPRRAIHNQHTNTTLQPNQPVGDAMLVPVARQGPEIELGYRFAAHAWGIGLATEAARALIPYAFQTLALTEIIAVTDPDNHASQRVLAKLGFQNRGNTDRYYNQTTTRFTLARPHAPSL
jgi:RimJ/RimL family protein N-acetyltransferase